MTDPTLLTIRCSMLLYAAALAAMLVSRRRWSWRPHARLLYTAGCALYLAHVAAAFHLHHQWSHARAYAEVARQTADFTGVASGAGLWLNYLFTLAWSADALYWWIAGAEAYADRSPKIAWPLHGFLLFIAFNATVVFPTGPTRAAGIAATAGLVVLSFSAARFSLTTAKVGEQRGNDCSRH